MISAMWKTDDSLVPTILRSVLGLVVLAHGAQKLLGWFGGYGFSGTMGFFTETMGLPWVVGFLVIVIEFFGALALMAGIATRFLAIAFTGLGLGILLLVHFQHGFYMNWGGNQAGEGIEFFLLWLAISGVLILTGGGRFSVDRFLANR